MLNGVTDLVMMKADVLDELDKIGIVTQYEVDGEIFNLPHFETITNDCLPVIEYIDGWKQEISDFRTWDDLPESFTNYIDFLERNFDLPISVISLGPGRIQTIIRQLKQEA
jgi:adenylosuccinate synthase